MTARIETVRLQRSSDDFAGMLDISLELYSKTGIYRLRSEFPSAEVALDEGAIRGIREEIARQAIPLGAFEGMVGCDGVTYKLTITSGFQEARFQWWCDPPPGWEGLARIAEMLEQLAHIGAGS